MRSGFLAHGHVLDAIEMLDRDDLAFTRKKLLLILEVVLVVVLIASSSQKEDLLVGDSM